LTAPQQPEPRATCVVMPTASSSRMVAASMAGIIDGCVQPARISTCRGCSLRGRCPAARRRGTLFCTDFGNSGCSIWPARIATPNKGEVSPLPSASRCNCCPAGR
jgi:hypothetical protein